ncbi:MAG: hypothetical protein ACFFE1_16605, partial [Candidatus Thorarchaeota archaeon]
ELERLGGLFNLTSDKSRSFLNRCSETKYLAVRNYSRATSLTVELAKQTLKEVNTDFTTREDCEEYLETLRKAVEIGQIDSQVISALKKLRAKYLDKVLRPAVKVYLDNYDLKITEIEALYNDALRIEGLLEVVRFLKKVKPVV